MFLSFHSKVVGRNKVNSQANTYGPRVIEAIRPLIGTKVKLVTGAVSQKFKNLIKETLAGAPIWQWHINVNYSYLIYLHLRACENYNGIAHYQERSIYLGKLNGGILEDVATFEPFKCDYHVDDILKARAEVRRLEKEISNLKSSYAGFDEYD